MKIKRLPQTIVLLAILVSCIYQRPDMKTDMSVGIPKFNSDTSPVVLFDAGHENFHDIQSTYMPFATLLKNDGIILSTHAGAFTEEALKNIDLLIIANAMAADQQEGSMASAFSENEIIKLIEWIKQGGSLLFIADHDPFGSAAAGLAKALGVGMESVWTVDTLRVNPEIGRNTWLEYSSENKGLGEHPILQADSAEAAIHRVITFTGQSLSFDST